jgi:hypothetical protein
VTTELIGRARVTYHNNSPDELRYLWFQLEQNRFRDDSLGARAQPAPDLSKPTPIGSLRQWIEQHEWEGGYRDITVTDTDGKPLRVTIVDTMMRVDLPAPLPPGGRFACDMSWRFLVMKNTTSRARSNYELLGENDTTRPDADLAPLYVMAQFFPRAAPYTDMRGWQHKQFLGQGEFALEFGDYTLAVTVPDNWTVAATGELENAAEVLAHAHSQAARATAPVIQVRLRGQTGVLLEALDVAHGRLDEGGVVLEVLAAHAVLARRQGGARRRLLLGEHARKPIPRPPASVSAVPAGAT